MLYNVVQIVPHIAVVFGIYDVVHVRNRNRIDTVWGIYIYICIIIECVSDWCYFIVCFWRLFLRRQYTVLHSTILTNVRITAWSTVLNADIKPAASANAFVPLIGNWLL